MIFAYLLFSTSLLFTVQHTRTTMGTGTGDKVNVVQQGHTVVYRKDNILKLGVAASGSKGRLGQLFFSLDQVIGHPYGSVFEIQKNGKLVLASHRPDVMVTEVDGVPTGDNREINDGSRAQKLDHEQITQLKQEGIGGEAIIQKLVENSETFQKRTEFSQAKYLKKKQKKYLQLVTILKPCARLICELFYERGPMKIINLRVDSLAQLHMQAHVHPGMRLLVADTCQGLVVGSALERMGGLGECVHLYTGDPSALSALEAFNLSPNERSILKQFRLDEMHEIPSIAAQSIEDIEVELVKMAEKKAKWNRETDGKWDNAWEQRVTKRTEIKRLRKAVADTLQKNSFDGLVIATRYHPTKVLMDLLPYLGHSRTFAVFFPYREPLMEAYQACRNQGGLLRIDLFETWTRPYQVLPMRTHPVMVMNANSGFVLTAIKVDNSGPDPPPRVTSATPSAQQSKKRRTKR